MEDVVGAGGSRRRGRIIARRVAIAAPFLLLIYILPALTMPEFILFRERLVLNLLEIESDVELQPVDLGTHDGLLLRSWYHPPTPGKPVIVYFPGRIGDLIRKPAHLFQFAEQGYGLMLAGYRGYGGNPGRPSETMLYQDATTLLNKVMQEGLAPDGIVLYGYSLGTGVASYLATQARPRAVILEAPFTSFPDVVSRQTPTVPLWLVRSRDRRADPSSGRAERCHHPAGFRRGARFSERGVCVASHLSGGKPREHDPPWSARSYLQLSLGPGIEAARAGATPAPSATCPFRAPNRAAFPSRACRAASCRARGRAAAWRGRDR
jgi:uncharacterized protein